MSATIDLPDRDAVAAERDHRLAKLEGAARPAASSPIPRSTSATTRSAALRERFAGARPRTGSPVPRRSVAGRLMLIRRHGGAVFATLEDQTGGIQLLASRETRSASRRSPTIEGSTAATGSAPPAR